MKCFNVLACSCVVFISERLRDSFHKLSINGGGNGVHNLSVNRLIAAEVRLRSDEGQTVVLNGDTKLETNFKSFVLEMFVSHEPTELRRPIRDGRNEELNNSTQLLTQGRGKHTEPRGIFSNRMEKERPSVRRTRSSEAAVVASPSQIKRVGGRLAF